MSTIMFVVASINILTHAEIIHCNEDDQMVKAYQIGIYWMSSKNIRRV